MLYPNCSETCFKLTGSFKQIRGEVFKMIDAVEKGWRYDKMLDKKHKAQLEEKREQVRECKTLEDIERIVFTFTSNGYETFFKKQGDEIWSYTSNNNDWDGVNYIDLPDEESEGKIVPESYTMKIILQTEDIILLKNNINFMACNLPKGKNKLLLKRVDNKKMTYFTKTSFIYTNPGNCIDVYIRDNKIWLLDEETKLIEMEEIEDINKLPNKLKAKIVGEML